MKVFWKNSNEIDEQKWEDCIYSSGVNLVYPHYWYLNLVAERWGAFVNEDYSCIMPVVWNKKFGLKYAYRPFLVQQLGFYSKNKQQADIEEFIKHLQKRFVKANYPFNYSNQISNNKAQQNTNFILDLSKSYEQLKKDFSTNTKRNISKATKNNLTLIENLSIDEFIDFKIKNLKNNLTKANFATLKKLCISQKQNTHIWGIKSSGELVSAFLLLHYNHKFYYLAAATNQQGKQLKASFLLMDNFIRKYATTDNLLDFEGSNIQGLARYFESWGATKQNYQTLNFFVAVRQLLLPANFS